MDWFEFTGSNPTLPSDYTLVSPAPTCGGNDQICAIQAVKNSINNKPVLTEALKDEMIIALNDSTASTNVLLKV